MVLRETWNKFTEVAFEIFEFHEWIQGNVKISKVNGVNYSYSKVPLD